ncbi:hypothetical protein [Achromobacter insuavis]|uniref:hypothetical protein n=1 Tax=Achromobacter insuavis TaxID=1287735 RepID=UPI001F12C26F|nr:hypothetical protein [Achromobacter insuavis]
MKNSDSETTALAADTSVPAYYAMFGRQRVPFLVAPLFVSPQARLQLTPAMKRALDRTVEITGRQGLATAIVSNEANIQALARNCIGQVSLLHDVILLFLCQSEEKSERLMAHLYDTYQLQLVTEPPPPGAVLTMQPESEAWRLQ